MEIKPSKFRKFLLALSIIIMIIAICITIGLVITMLQHGSLFAKPGSVLIDNADFSWLLNGFSVLFIIALFLSICGSAGLIIATIWAAYWFCYFVRLWLQNRGWFRREKD